MSYAELQVTSNFSFLRGASHPDELVTMAARHQLAAIAVTDRNTLAGVVRAHCAAKEVGISFLPGARLDLTDGHSLLCFPTDRAAYGRLSTLLTVGKRRAPKGQCYLSQEDLRVYCSGQILISIPPDKPDEAFAEELRSLKADFGDACYLAAHHLYRGNDAARLQHLFEFSAHLGIPLVATNDVHYHERERRKLQDVLTCIREGCTIDEAGYRLFANAERHLKSAEEMTRLFGAYPDALARTQEIVDRCHFSLDELRYEYPVDPVPEGSTPQAELARLTWEGAARRYPSGISEKLRSAIDHELALIEKLGYAPYFLTVHDIVQFARSQDILCQGRGSAANSAVCFCIGITSVDPAKIDLLFERFISAERDEPPDIDVDFEHERREEVVQYIYKKYTRDRAGLTANLITYRTKSAIRDVGKALGMSEDVTRALASMVWGTEAGDLNEEMARQRGINPRDRRVRLALQLTHQILGFPRHLSQHPGGFVITKLPLHEVVPIENAAMADRTVIEWNKEDIDALGILKIDVLALGMLTCIRKAFDLIAIHYGRRYDLATIPQDDSHVYDMLCLADSVGVFQVESRAQMTMLPRLRPRCFYDLVIEVAIVRPGPIQGDMVHPYLRRREKKELVEYPSEDLRQVLERTLGVPLFQEQAMKIAIVAGGFTPSEADQLRRAMAAFRRAGTIQMFGEKLISGMIERGYEPDFAERCFRQIEGFGEYGFPESHAASFALLVYVSAWLKCRHPAAFTAALLNSQPMGFYAPGQIVRDAREHRVEVWPVDVNNSFWDCTLESTPTGEMGVRLGFRQIKGVREIEIAALIANRGNGYQTLQSLWRRGRLKPSAIERLADGDAYGSLGLSRRQALWEAKALAPAPLPLFAASGEEELPEEPEIVLPSMSLPEEVSEDYRALTFSLKAHPVSFLRDQLTTEGITPNGSLVDLPDGKSVTVAGLVLVRQRPATASGTIFMTTEDETGIANLIIWPKVLERYRRAVLASQLVIVRGKLQREGMVVHVIATSLVDTTDRLGDLLTAQDRSGALMVRSRDFR